MALVLTQVTWLGGVFWINLWEVNNKQAVSVEFLKC